MILICKEAINISASSKTIFEFVVDMENFQKWFEGVVSIKSACNTPINQIGKKYIEIVRLPIGQKEIELSVTDFKESVLFATEGNYWPLMPRMEIEIQENKAECSLEWRMYSRNNALIFKTLFLPWIKQEINRRATKSLLTLKHIIEAMAE